MSEAVRQRAVKDALRQVSIPTRGSCHTLWPSCATPLLEDGYDIRTVQALLGHQDVSTTMVSTHVVQRGGRGVHSPLDPRSVLRTAIAPLVWRGAPWLTRLVCRLQNPLRIYYAQY